MFMSNDAYFNPVGMENREARIVQPATSIYELTGPIGPLASNETQSETNNTFWQVIDKVYAQSLDSEKPLKKDHISILIQAGIEKIKKFIRHNGSHAFTQEGNVALAWFDQLNESLAVIEGDQRHVKVLGDVIEQICSMRERRATASAKLAGRQGLGISSDGSIIYTKSNNPYSEKVQADDVLAKIKRENEAVKKWISDEYEIPNL